jgi:hypothetical protein
MFRISRSALATWLNHVKPDANAWRLISNTPNFMADKPRDDKMRFVKVSRMR